jgi:anti-sigma28 factor (negative regulator of flagellin synthesis)
MTHKTIEQEKKLTTNESYDIVDLYLQPEFIKILTQQTATQPKVDHAKIQSIKHAMKTHSFTVNDLLLAEKMIKFESELFKK